MSVHNPGTHLLLEHVATIHCYCFLVATFMLQSCVTKFLLQYCCYHHCCNQVWERLIRRAVRHGLDGFARSCSPLFSSPFGDPGVTRPCNIFVQPLMLSWRYFCGTNKVERHRWSPLKGAGGHSWKRQMFKFSVQNMDHMGVWMGYPTDKRAESAWGGRTMTLMGHHQHSKLKI